MRSRKIKKIFIKFLLSLVSATVTYFAIETILAIGSYYFYPRLITRDDTLGWKYKPTPKKMRRHFSKDIVYDIYINSEGFRDNEFVHNQDYWRIMVLGDSMTFGMETKQEDIFCSVLEKRLKALYPNRNIDVMNFGITGFSTGQELLCLKKYGDMYNPDVVILMLFAGNDFEDNITEMYTGRYRPHFLLRKGVLLLQNEPTVWQRATTFIRDHSFLMYIFSNRLGVTHKLFTKERNVDEKGKIALMCKILDEFYLYTKGKKIPLLVYYIGGADLSDPRFETVRQCCSSKNIFLQTIPLKEEERAYGVVHWNSKGHYSVAELLYNQLSNRGALKGLD